MSFSAEDHGAAGKAMALEQDKEQDAFALLQSIFLDRLTAIEAVVGAWYPLRSLAAAMAYELDTHGINLRLERPSGLSDPEYRKLLIARVMQLHSAGTGPELVAIQRQLVPTGSLAAPLFIRRWPKGVEFQIPDLPPGDIAVLTKRILCEAIPAGDQCIVISFDAAGGYFAFDEDSDPNAQPFDIGTFASEL